MFSSYQISNPTVNNSNVTRKNVVNTTHDSRKSATGKIPRRRATISAQQAPTSIVSTKRTHSSSPDNSNTNCFTNVLPSDMVSDPKLQKKCAVVIERSEEVAQYEKQQIAFINGLLEKQREMQRQRALKREEFKRLLMEKREASATLISEMTALISKERPNLTNPNADELNVSPVRRKVVKKKQGPMHRYERARLQAQERRKQKAQREVQAQVQIQEKGQEHEKEKASSRENKKEEKKKIVFKSNVHVDFQVSADDHSQSSEILSTHLENELNSSNITLETPPQEQRQEMSVLTPNNSCRDEKMEHPNTCEENVVLPVQTPKPKSMKRQLQQLRNRVEVRQCMGDPSSEDCSLYGSISMKQPKSPTKSVKVRLKRARLDEEGTMSPEKPASQINPTFIYEFEPKSINLHHNSFVELQSGNEPFELILSADIRNRVNDIKQRLKAQLFQMKKKYGSLATSVVKEALIKSKRRVETKRIPIKVISKRINRKARKHVTPAKQKTKPNKSLGARKVIKYYSTFEGKVKAQLGKQTKNRKRLHESQRKGKQKRKRAHEAERERQICDAANETTIVATSNKQAENEECEGLVKDVEQKMPDASVTKVICNTISVDKSECVAQTDNFDCSNKPPNVVGTVTVESSEELNQTVACQPTVSPSSRSDDEIEISKEMAAAATSLTMLANKKAAMTMTVTITSRVLESETGEAILATAIGIPPPTPTESLSNISRLEPNTVMGDAATSTSKSDDSGATQLTYSVSEEEDANGEYLPLSQQVRSVADLKNIVEATTVNVIKDATMTMLSFEATATLPTYLFNGESRDVPTPTPAQALLCNATPASIATATSAGVAETATPLPLPPPPISTTIPLKQVKNHEPSNANKAETEPCKLSIDSTIVTDKLEFSTSDHEVSSTQESVQDRAKRNSSTQIKMVDLCGAGDTSTMVQNNQIDTTHHFSENTPNLRRKIRKYSDEFSSRLIEDKPQHKKRRKTICSESNLRVQFAPDTFFYDSSSGSSPSTTSVKELKGRKRARLSKNSVQLPPPNTPTRCTLRSFAFARPYSFDLVDAPELKIPNVIPPINLERIKRNYRKENVAQEVFVPPYVEQCLDEAEVEPQVETTTMICELPQSKRNARNGGINSKLQKGGVNAKQSNYTSVKGVRMKMFRKDSKSTANKMGKVEIPKRAVRNTGRKRK